MFVIAVTPINKGIFKDQLSYFSTQEIPIGSIVTVPVKNRSLDALVIGSRSATDLKSELKNSNFALKKIGSVKKFGLFLPEFLAACAETADHYALTLGQAIKAALPQVILENLERSQRLPNVDKIPEPENSDGTVKQNKFILQDAPEERLSYYKALIRESFAKKQSVLLLLPVAGDVEKYAAAFGAGIKDFTVVLHGDLPKKTLWQNWNKAIDSAHPLLLIATPGFLAIARRDLKVIVLEKESHTSYRSFNRPVIDFRFLAEKLADQLSARFILGDLVLRAETIFKTERGDYAHLTGLKYRSASAAEQGLLEIKNFDPGDKNVYAISDALRQVLRTAIDNREKTLIYSGKKGLNSTTVCNDCGQIVRCSHCQSPLVLHKNQLERKYFYLCHKCGRPEETADKCRFCDSWRLSLLGSGIEKAQAELEELFPAIPIFRLDGDTPKPAKRAELVQKFYNTRGPAILLGTDAVTGQLSDKIANVVVIGLDALFSVPDFRISEKIFNVLLSLRSYAQKRFLIQTRNPKEKVFAYATAGNLIDFYRDEIEERMKFGYPPFKVLIKISREGKSKEVADAMEELADRLADYSPLFFPASTDFPAGRAKGNAIIKLPAKSWIDARLLDKLKSLSPDWQIEIAPESIL